MERHELLLSSCRGLPFFLSMYVEALVVAKGSLIFEFEFCFSHLGDDQTFEVCRHHDALRWTMRSIFFSTLGNKGCYVWLTENAISVCEMIWALMVDGHKDHMYVITKHE